ncbi:MAG TPA: HAD-IA family hydrolase [Opitutales bacterium]|nr:HAD-IA family hydrolase [Opitutales bacterium]
MESAGKFDWVILDAMGVIYKNGDDVSDLMIPYLRKNGCELPDDAIIRAFERCSGGDIDSDDMWRLCGIDNPDGADMEHCSFYQLSSGLMPTLAAIRARGLRIACLSNGPVEWSRLLRRRFGLEKYVDAWIVSGEVRCEKPDEKIYRILLEKIGADPRRCLFADDNPRNIPPAEKLGIATLLFRNDKSDLLFARLLSML